ncbi:MAG TPA: glycosyltransferase [Thermohalobaculum sp.]|nr:glycosyltransferase [Thermohalobaculum sp.]
MSKPRIAVLLPYEFDRTPAQRFRWEQWLPHLEAHGLEVELVTFSTAALSAARKAGRRTESAVRFAARYAGWLGEVARAARRADLIVVARNAALAGPPLAEAALAALGRPIVYDFDDAIYLPPESGDNLLRRLVRCDWRCRYISARAMLVGVGCPGLGAWARRHNPNVVLWPTTVDTGRYRLRGPAHEGPLPVIGWTGSPSTALYISELLPTLAELQRETEFEVLVIGAEVDLAGHGLRGRCEPWSPDTEVALISAIDIGLMPLADTPWARGKCALKAIQYLALGAPAVVSDVGVNRDVVRDGESGYLVAPGGDWKAPLRRLLTDRDLRRRMGLRGREHIVRNYSAEAVGPQVARDLIALLERAPAAAGRKPAQGGAAG